MLKSKIKPFRIYRDKIDVLDQRKLPHIQEWVSLKTAEEVKTAIRDMLVRGAPAIGIVAAYGFYIGVWNAGREKKSLTQAFGERLKKKLDTARPTAVNLFWATEQMQKEYERLLGGKSIKTSDKNFLDLLLRLFQKVRQLEQDDANRCEQISLLGADYIEKKIRRKQYRILTHCNTGALATAGVGTALGVIRALAQAGKVEMVYADETRPYLQGSRLTAFELKQDKIPVTLIADSAAAYLMQQGKIDFVIVGADRIAKNGDTANKIGTYSLAVNAKYHNIPFFVAAPKSSFDDKIGTMANIPIEERSAQEILFCGNTQMAPKVPALNYGFDLTPASLIQAIFTEEKVIIPNNSH
ncbi:MAG: S-methyl-5-thioribose-1-phosphate isomerase [Candidatus Hydrogenedentota bacterium]|nr:MAG: S-methyl-5-thioribose-1-phosphate isomerase [Candidatus Hydrogenedentota bacterium]